MLLCVSRKVAVGMCHRCKGGKKLKPGFYICRTILYVLIAVINCSD